MQKYFTHNFVSTFHGQKMDVGFNLALFIFRPQLFMRFSEKEKCKTGILAILYSVPCDNYYIYIFPLKRSVVGFFVAFLIFWIAYDTRKEPSRLISLVGLFIYILIGFLFSKHRDQVNN